MSDNIDNEVNNTNILPDTGILNENMNQEINNEFQVDQERLNDEGYEMNLGFDYDNGYSVLFRLGVPPTFGGGNGMGVGEYDGTFYSKMMEQAKVMGLDSGEGNDDKKEEYELNNGDKNMLGYISNEIYYPIKKDKKNVEIENKNKQTGIMDISVGELFENTSMVLNNFEDDFLNALHKVDIEFNYSSTDNGMVKNIKRYVMAFMVYLQEGNNILYIGITLFIISIILYFINIIRGNDKSS